MRYPVDWADNLRKTPIIADYQVARLHPTGEPDRKIATVILNHVLKGGEPGERIKLTFVEGTSCSGETPEIGSIARQQTLYHSDHGTYSSWGCTLQQSPVLLEWFGRERDALKKNADASPDEVDAQIALITFYNYWGDYPHALSRSNNTLKKAPDNGSLHFQRALALAGLGRLSDARSESHRAYDNDTHVQARVDLFQAQLQGLEAFADMKSIKDRNFYGVRFATNMFGDLTGADLSQTILTDLKLHTPLKARNSDWTRAHLRNVGIDQSDFSGARMNEIVFDDAGLNGVNFSSVEALKAAFNHSQLSGADMRDMRALESSFVRTFLRRADLRHGIFSKSDFTEADLTGARLDGTNLNGAILSKARLNHASLIGTSLKDAHLLGAEIGGTDLSAAELKGANLTGARIDCDTRFPTTFNRGETLLIPLAHCVPQILFVFSHYHLPKLEWNEQLNFSHAVLDGADFRNLNRSLNIKDAIVDGADFSETTASLDFSGVSAKGARFDRLRGDLTIRFSDLTGAYINGATDHRPTFLLSHENSHLDDAEIEHVLLKIFDASNFGEPNAETSLHNLHIRHSLITCFRTEPMDIRITGTELGEEDERRKTINEFITTLDFSRRLAATDSSNNLEESCGKAIELYLGDQCRRGFIKAGFTYTCPAAP